MLFKITIITLSPAHQISRQMNTEAQCKILFFPMGFISLKLYGNENSMGNFDSLKFNFIIIVTMLPLSMFMNNIAVLCIHISEKISFLF